MPKIVIRSIAGPMLAAIRIAGIAAASVLLSAQTAPQATAPLFAPNQFAPAPVKHTFNWVPALRAHIRKCWSPPAGGAPTASVRIYFELRRNGTLASPPRHIQFASDGAPPPLAQSAIQAIEKCQPYSFLPQSEYAAGWDRIDMTFELDKPVAEPRKAGGNANVAPGDAAKIPEGLAIMKDERKR